VFVIRLAVLDKYREQNQNRKRHNSFGKPQRKIHIPRLEDNIKRHLTENGVRMWAIFKWLKLGSSSGLEKNYDGNKEKRT
jgi:hypothetical protein